MKYIFTVLGLGLAVVLIALVYPVIFSPTTPESVVPEQKSEQGSGVVHAVVLTRDGYQPAEITISQGDTVTFSTNETYDRFHWPASNLHPTHDIYPEFDPGEPVASDEVWSFVFTKIGEWRFHDHIAPYFTGIVIVQ